jgi:hypothetical protein
MKSNVDTETKRADRRTPRDLLTTRRHLSPFLAAPRLIHDLSHAAAARSLPSTAEEHHMTGAERVGVRTAYWHVQDVLACLGATRPRDENLGEVVYAVYCKLLDVERGLRAPLDIVLDAHKREEVDACPRP